MYEDSPNSGVLVLPRLMKPARRISSTTYASVVGTFSRMIAEPMLVGTWAVEVRSFNAVGTPRNCVASWPARRASASAA